MTPKRTTIYLDPASTERLDQLKAEYGLGTSAACRVGLAILEATLNGESQAEVLDSENVKPRRREREMYTIDAEKLEAVVSLFNAEVDPKATDDLIESEICADWHEGDEHQAWIDSAEPAEIVDWLASFYQD